MLIEQIATQMAKAGGIGIASELARGAQVALLGGDGPSAATTRSLLTARIERPLLSALGVGSVDGRRCASIRRIRCRTTVQSNSTKLAHAAPELDIGGYLPTRRSRSPEPAQPAAPAVSAITAALDRLEGLVDEESEALETRAPVDLDAINRRKSHSLLEITRLARSLPLSVDPGLRVRLSRLRDRLVANHRLLGLHLAAVREIADLMVGVLSEAESDGTYDMTGARRGARP